MCPHRKQPLHKRIAGRLRRHRSIIARAAIAILLLTGLFTLHVQLDETLRRMARARGDFMLIAVGAFLVGQWLTILKWKWLLDGVGSRLGKGLLTRASLVGLFYNNFLPGSVGGDVAKILMVAPRTGGKARAAASVFTQRNTGVAALLLIGMTASLMWPVHMAAFPRAMDVLNHVWVWFAVTSAAYCAINAGLLSDAAYERVWRLFDADATREAHGWRAVAAHLKFRLWRLHDSLRVFRPGLPWAVILSVVTQLLDCIVVYWVMRSLGLSVGFPFFLVSVPLVTLASLVPVSINGLGLRESVYLVLMRTVGVPPEVAVGTSLIQFGLFLALSLAGGAIHWLTPGRGAAAGTTSGAQ